MTRIGNADHIMVLLRQQLQRMDKTRGKARSSGPGASTPAAPRNAIDRIASLATLDDLDDRQFERALIRALLTDEFGAAMAEDHRFERIAGEVHRIIRSEKESRELLSATVDQMRASGT